MSWWNWVLVGVYGVGFFTCWRVVTLGEVEAAEAMRAPPDGLWEFALLYGFVMALVWPLVLLFSRCGSGV